MISHTSAEYVACLAGEMRETGRECRDGKRGGGSFSPLLPFPHLCLAVRATEYVQVEMGPCVPQFLVHYLAYSSPVNPKNVTAEITANVTLCG